MSTNVIHSLAVPQPPVVPKVHFDGDTSNFDEYPETDWKAARSLDEIELQLFDNF